MAEGSIEGGKIAGRSRPKQESDRLGLKSTPTYPPNVINGLAPQTEKTTTRAEILKGMGWTPFKMGPGVPAAVVEEENRQGMAAHIAKVDAAERGRKEPKEKTHAGRGRPAKRRDLMQTTLLKRFGKKTHMGSLDG